MRRLLASLVVLGLPAGCAGSGATSPLDPFSPTRIEAPRTGWITNQPAADPYYSGTRQAAVPRPAARSGWRATSPAIVPRAGGLSGPPRDLEYQPGKGDLADTLAAGEPGDRIAVPPAARREPTPSDGLAGLGGGKTFSGPRADAVRQPASPGAATSSAVPTTRALAGSDLRKDSPPTSTLGTRAQDGQQQIIRTIEPRPRSATSVQGVRAAAGATATAQREPRRLAVPRQAIDIMDLPPTGSAKTARPSAASSGVRLASATEIVDESGSGGTRASSGPTTRTGGEHSDSFSPRARYAYDPQYGWLRGRLEYSQIDRRWKLRYIPIDGTTDEFGGSVVLTNVSLLSGYERGEFVEVRGTLGRRPRDEHRFAPEFEIRQIKRLGS